MGLHHIDVMAMMLHHIPVTAKHYASARASHHASARASHYASVRASHYASVRASHHVAAKTLHSITETNHRTIVEKHNPLTADSTNPHPHRMIRNPYPKRNSPYPIPDHNRSSNTDLCIHTNHLDSVMNLYTLRLNTSMKYYSNYLSHQLYHDTPYESRSSPSHLPRSNGVPFTRITVCITTPSSHSFQYTHTK